MFDPSNFSQNVLTAARTLLLALQAQQLSDLTAAVAAQGRAQALDAAQRQAASSQAQEQLRRFLQTPTGYQPSTVGDRRRGRAHLRAVAARREGTGAGTLQHRQPADARWAERSAARLQRTAQAGPAAWCAAAGRPRQADPERRWVNSGNAHTRPADPEAQRLAQERQRLAQEMDAARTSRLFASEARAATQSAAATGSGPQGTTAPLLDQAALGPNVGGASQPTESDRKLAFLNGPVDRRTTSADRVQAPASRNVVQAGSVISAAMITGLRSDLPGQITAQITESIYDSPTGKILLILQGARLIGQYDAQVAFGQSRALLVWNRIVMPNGRSIVLERQPGADPEGYAGLEDQVDNHWGALFRAALLSTILSVGSEAGTSNDENGLVDAIRRGASDSISQTGRQVVGRSLQVQPTITVRPGFPVRVIVTRDLVMEPYLG